LLPTNLGSGELRQLDAAIKRQSIFSARTLSEYYLGKIKNTVESIINPKQVEREGNDQTVTEGFNPATARQELRSVLQQLGYSPAAGEEGTIKDLASDGRLQLVVNTNTQLAQGAGAFIKSNDPDVVDEYPAWALVRFEDREHPRNWDGDGEEKKGSPFGSRWMLAAQTCGDVDAARILDSTGRMVALKSSDIWQALGDGAGGFEDTLGNPFPPFAFNSGMWTQDVSRADAEELGLLDKGEKAEPAALDLASLFMEALS
jgi:hypothetical protein